MLDLAAIRRAASGCRAAVGLDADAATDAARVTALVAERLDISVARFKPNRVRGPDVLGTLNARARQMHVAERLPAGEAAMVEAHELGHYVLHKKSGHRFADARQGAGSSPHGTFAAIGYSERERLELEADAFAIELLCPAEWLRRQIAQAARTPAEVAAELGLPHRDVLAHAVGAVLNPHGDCADRCGPERPTLWRDPVDTDRSLSRNSIVEVGPGGGTLEMAALRVRHLLRDGVAPDQVLVLAASEGVLDAMRLRLATDVGAPSGRVWSGTPASLGFEIFVKNARRAARSPGFRLLDEAGARARFEEARRRMAPKLSAWGAFDAVYGAKVRLVDPTAWLVAAEADGLSARTTAERDRARVTVDLGRAWAAYELRLADDDAIDAADLAAVPVRLLRTDADVLEGVSSRFRHLVAVGLQDFEPGGVEMVRLLAKAGVVTWAAGDPARCIARHAGARPQAMTDLARDLGAETATATRDILRTGPLAGFVDLAARSATIPVPIPARRPEVHHSACRTAGDEAQAIAARVETLRRAGVPVRDQVVVAHAHYVLKAVAKELERLGVATTMLPDLRDEPAVRDLLAVASLANSANVDALERVAASPSYALSAEELVRAREWVRDRSAGAPCRSTPRGGALGRLVSDFEGLDGDLPAAAVMKMWVFERSDYLSRVLRDPDAARRDRVLASVHHVIRIAEEHEAQRDGDHARLDKRVRGAGGLRQVTAFGRAAAPGTEGTLRVMTIHAARGSVFRAVHVAGVRNGSMEIKGHSRRPHPHPPTGLAALWDASQDVADIEAALFRVAVSRATEYLHVSGAEDYRPGIPRGDRTPIPRRAA